MLTAALPTVLARGLLLAGISFVQTTGQDQIQAFPFARTFARPSAPGNTVVVTAVWNRAAGASLSITDDQGNRYSPALPELVGVGSLNFLASQIFVASGIDAGTAPLTLTYQLPDGGNLEFNQLEYSGVDPRFPLDASLSVALADGTPTQRDGGVTQASAGTVETLIPGELLLVWYVSAFTVVAPGPGFANRSTVGADMVEDQLTTLPGAYPVVAVSQQPWTVQVVGLRPTGGVPRLAVGCSTASHFRGPAWALLAVGAWLARSLRKRDTSEA